MKPSLQLRVSQHLALTPQLQQSIRLLQLSTLELGQEVSQMLDDNPFLERASDEAERESFGLAQADTPLSGGDAALEAASYASFDAPRAKGTEGDDDAPDTVLSSDDALDWDGDGSVSLPPDDSEWGGDAPARGNNLSRDDDVDATGLASDQESLQSFLHRQALALYLGDEDAAALRFLIESLNDDGYLDDDLAELARGLAGLDDDEFEQLLHHFTVALHLLQSLEPVGVGARHLAECLTLQLRALRGSAACSVDTVDVALRICAQPLDLLARRDVKRLAPLVDASDSAVRNAIGLIGHLEPKPGRRFVDVQRNVVIPDVLVLRNDAASAPTFEVRLNPEVLPRLRVHDVYAGALKGYKASGSDAANALALQQRLQEARWFIKNIQQRFDTILRVSTAIVERQKAFFIHGELAMRPLVLREIADELGLHESTISRVTTAKYMATPHGTFELKHFFGSGLATESGGNASSTAVRALIKQFIDSENRKKPLSDSQLSDMLKEQGIECARRTVAKYREGLRIATASLRKEL